MARESKRSREEKRFGRPERLADMAMSTPLKSWMLPPFVIEAGKQEVDLCGETVIEIKDHLIDCPVIDGTNAARAYWDHPQDVWMHDDFPNVAAPFPKFFIETSHPGFITVDNGKRCEPASWCPRKWGLLFLAQPGPCELPIEGESPDVPEISMLDIPAGGWAIQISLVISWDGQRPAFWPAMGFMGVDPTGGMVRWPMFMAPRLQKRDS
jgi:hypothetical protein